MIPIANTFIAEWFSFIVNSSVQLAIFLIIILAVSILMKKQSATFLYGLWVIGLCKIFIPVNLPIPDLSGKAEVIEKAMLTFTYPGIDTTAVNLGNMHFQSILFDLWAAGIVLLLSLWFYQVRQFNKELKAKEVSMLCRNELMDDLNVKVYVVSGVQSPFTRGILRQKIYLPSGALSWDKEEIDAVILHEYAHIKRRDTAFIFFQNIIQIAYFFHPLVWIANRQISRYREKACDDYVINRLKGNTLAYGRLLLKSINMFYNEQSLPVSINSFGKSKKFIFQRFEYILNRNNAIQTKFNMMQKCVLLSLVIFALALSLRGNLALEAANRNKGAGVETFSQPLQMVKKSENNAIPALRRVEKVSASGSTNTFVPYDTPPQPIGGFAQIQKNLYYPEIARKTGVEGRVLVHAKIEKDGSIAETKILESLGKSGCDEAAIKAIKSVRWTPAVFQGQTRGVWVAIPVAFRLR